MAPLDSPSRREGLLIEAGAAGWLCSDVDWCVFYGFYSGTRKNYYYGYDSALFDESFRGIAEQSFSVFLTATV